MSADKPVSTTPPATALERAVMVHTGLYFVGATWAFGGNADFVQPYLGAWGSLGIVLTMIAAFTRDAGGQRERLLRSLWPILAFNTLTGLACLTIGFRAIHSGAEMMYLPRDIPAWKPSSALPRMAGWTLWLFDGIYFSAFNLLVVIRSRRRLRALFVLFTVNTLALAVFGTLQKLVHSTGIYFGRVRSPQPYFFSTFVYDNHWGAFIILMIGLCLGLMWHYADRADDRGFFHSPAFGGAVALLFLFITVPLSGARTCSALLLVFLILALWFWYQRWRRHGLEAGTGRGVAAPLIVAGALAFGAAATWFVARDVIAARTEKTVSQVHEFKAMHGLGTRSQLYRDTWKMAQDRLWFGWGMGSYPTVFQMYNTEEIDHQDLLPKFYHDAHSDWLQTIAEHGLIGGLLLAACGLVPLFNVGRPAWSNRLSRHCFAGCTLVLLYAWMEFPFGNYAVCLTWCLLFFAAIRYGALSPQRHRPAP